MMVVVEREPMKALVHVAHDAIAIRAERSTSSTTDAFSKLGKPALSAHSQQVGFLSSRRFSLYELNSGFGLC